MTFFAARVGRIDGDNKRNRRSTSEAAKAAANCVPQFKYRITRQIQRLRQPQGSCKSSAKIRFNYCSFRSHFAERPQSEDLHGLFGDGPGGGEEAEPRVGRGLVLGVPDAQGLEGPGGRVAEEEEVADEVVRLQVRVGVAQELVEP